MAILWDSQVRPADLTQFVRRLPELWQQTYVLNQILPDRYIHDEEVELADVFLTARTAKARTYDDTALPIKRDSFSRRKVKLPAVSAFMSQGEVDKRRLLVAQARANVGPSDALLEAAIYDDATAVTQSVVRKVELMRGDLLTDGAISLPELGAGITAQFNVPGGNFVTAGTLWSNAASSVPLTDLRTWAKSYRDLNGFYPGSMIFSEDIWYLLAQNAQIKGTFLSPNASVPPFADEAQVTSALRAGRGIPPVKFTYDAQVDVDGTLTNILPKNTVWFLPPEGVELGFTAWGLTANSDQFVGNGSLPSDQAPGITSFIDQGTDFPYNQAVYADSSVLPVLSNPRALMICTVA